MRLTGPKGDSLELNIAGYQFQDQQPQEGLDDANWLRISLQASAMGHRWGTVDACLLTWEALQLAEWLESIAQRQAVDSKIEFLEPNLSLEVREKEGEQALLRAYFELECRPKSLQSNRAGMKDLWAELRLSSADLQRWAEDLREQLKRFPPRGDISSHYDARSKS